MTTIFIIKEIAVQFLIFCFASFLTRFYPSVRLGVFFAVAVLVFRAPLIKGVLNAISIQDEEEARRKRKACLIVFAFYFFPTFFI